MGSHLETGRSGDRAQRPVAAGYGATGGLASMGSVGLSGGTEIAASLRKVQNKEVRRP
jgi:hypothetical protein